MEANSALADAIKNNTVLPAEQLIRIHADAIDHVHPLAERRAESMFARHHWDTSESELPVDLHGAFFRMKRTIARGLGLDELAHHTALQWAAWASDRREAAEIWQARARLAEDEATRYLTFLSDDFSASADESEVPLLARMVKELPELRDLITGDASAEFKDFSFDGRQASESLQPTIQHAQDLSGRERLEAVASDENRRIGRALLDALLRVEACCIRVGRQDLAAPLQDVLRDLAQRPEEDDLRDAVALMDARQFHDDGDLMKAARTCAAGLKSPAGEPITASLAYRQNLAMYSMETEHFDTALRMLRANVQATEAQGLDLDHIVSTRLLGQVMIESGDTSNLLAVTSSALDATEGMPDSPIVMDVRLHHATELLGAGRTEEAQPLAEEIAAWSDNTSNHARTAHACRIAAIAAFKSGNYAHSAVLYDALAEVRSRFESRTSPAATLEQAATEMNDAATDPEIVENLMSRAAEYLDTPEETAHWYRQFAALKWANWDDVPARTNAEKAAEIFTSIDMPLEAADALTYALRSALSSNDDRASLEYLRRIHELAPGDTDIQATVAQIMADAETKKSAPAD
ncbi:hypothetical protein [Corynebacterium sp. H78]|uniref:hypothetical protein n=1 Tax=Corynebacterium sp. H78 TaxID=3133417 RepID=UPI0030A9438D